MANVLVQLDKFTAKINLDTVINGDGNEVLSRIFEQNPEADERAADTMVLLIIGFLVSLSTQTLVTIIDGEMTEDQKDRLIERIKNG